MQLFLLRKIRDSEKHAEKAQAAWTLTSGPFQAKDRTNAGIRPKMPAGSPWSTKSCPSMAALPKGPQLLRCAWFFDNALPMHAGSGNVPCAKQGHPLTFFMAATRLLKCSKAAAGNDPQMSARLHQLGSSAACGVWEGLLTTSTISEE